MKILKNYLVASSRAARSADFLDASVVSAFGSSRGDKKSSCDLHVDLQMNRMRMLPADFKIYDSRVSSQRIKSITRGLVLRNSKRAIWKTA